MKEISEAFDVSVEDLVEWLKLDSTEADVDDHAIDPEPTPNLIDSWGMKSVRVFVWIFCLIILQPEREGSRSRRYHTRILNVWNWQWHQRYLDSQRSNLCSVYDGIPWSNFTLLWSPDENARRRYPKHNHQQNCFRRAVPRGSCEPSVENGQGWRTHGDIDWKTDQNIWLPACMFHHWWTVIWVISYGLRLFNYLTTWTSVDITSSFVL